MARPIRGLDRCSLLIRSSAENAAPDFPSAIRLRAMTWRDRVLRSLNSLKAAVILFSKSIWRYPRGPHDSPILPPFLSFFPEMGDS